MERITQNAPQIYQNNGYKSQKAIITSCPATANMFETNGVRKLWLTEPVGGFVRSFAVLSNNHAILNYIIGPCNDLKRMISSH